MRRPAGTLRCLHPGLQRQRRRPRLSGPAVRHAPMRQWRPRLTSKKACRRFALYSRRDSRTAAAAAALPSAAALSAAAAAAATSTCPACHILASPALFSDNILVRLTSAAWVAVTAAPAGAAGVAAVVTAAAATSRACPLLAPPASWLLNPTTNEPACCVRACLLRRKKRRQWGQWQPQQ